MQRGRGQKPPEKKRGKPFDPNSKRQKTLSEYAAKRVIRHQEFTNAQVNYLLPMFYFLHSSPTYVLFFLVC